MHNCYSCSARALMQRPMVFACLHKAPCCLPPDSLGICFSTRSKQNSLGTTWFFLLKWLHEWFLLVSSLRWSPTRIQDHLRYHCVFILIAGLCCGFGQRSVNPWSLMDAHPGLAALVKSCLISAAVSECHDGGFSCFHEITNSSQYLTDLVV